MTIIRFSIQGDRVKFGKKERQKLTNNGCNEPYKDQYWCPKRKWFSKAPCPFNCQRECENYKAMCGVL